MPDDLLRNLHEVLNVLVGLYSRMSDLPIGLGEVSRGVAQRPDVGRAVNQPTGLTLRFAIPGYGGGFLSMVYTRARDSPAAGPRDGLVVARPRCAPSGGNCGVSHGVSYDLPHSRPRSAPGGGNCGVSFGVACNFPRTGHTSGGTGPRRQGPPRQWSMRWWSGVKPCSTPQSTAWVRLATPILR